MDEASSHVYHEEPKNPKDEQNYRDRPKHDGVLARSELHLARQEMSQARRTAQCSSERYGTAAYARWQPACLSYRDGLA
jgi:RecA/RadA recombinase